MNLDQQREEFKRRRFLAMPLAGTVAWMVIGIGSLFLSPAGLVWLTFIATGFIAYLGIMFSKLTGENFTDKNKPKNTFDTLFFYSVGMSLLVYAIAIPFFMIDYTTLPFTVGILAGLMWLPMSWIIQHWIGLFHAISRTLLLVAVYFLFPDQRFLASAIVVVSIYLITIVVLEKRWKAVNQIKVSLS
jgi:hypothetical protein